MLYQISGWREGGGEEWREEDKGKSRGRRQSVEGGRRKKD